MDNLEKLSILTGEVDRDLLSVYLDLAEEAFLSRLYPFGRSEDKTVPAQYNNSLLELATRYYMRRGAEGESYHAENGVNRTYASANDNDILQRVVPVVKIV